MGAQCLVENNVFINAVRTLITNLDSRDDGFANERGNEWGAAAAQRGPFITQIGNFTTAPYSYSLLPTGNVANLVRTNAGATMRF